MRAAVLRELGKPLVVEEVDVPPPARGQVLVRIMASGVCHTQVLEARGRRGPDPHLPHLLGHEGAGVVEAIGEGVTKVRPGDRVILSWIKGAGIEAAPPKYRRGGETISAGFVTTFQEATLAAENRVFPIPPEMPFGPAALVGCAVATGAGAVLHACGVKAGDSVAVFGVGGIGIAAVRAASIAGASIVIAVDVKPAKMDRARRLGATHAVNAAEVDPVQAIRDLTGGKGVDHAVECAGRRETMEAAFRSVRPGGGRAVLVGNLPRGQTISIDPFDLIRGKRIAGTWGGETVPERDFPVYVAWHLEGRFDLEALITHRFPLDGVNEALEVLERGEAGRAILEP